MAQINLVAGFTDYPAVPHNHTLDRVLARSYVGLAGKGERPLHPVGIGCAERHYQLRSQPRWKAASNQPAPIFRSASPISSSCVLKIGKRGRNRKATPARSRPDQRPLPGATSELWTKTSITHVPLSSLHRATGARQLR